MLSKKSCKDIIGHFFDNFMWYAIYLLPLLLMVVYWCKTGTCVLSDIMSWSGLGFVTDNIVFTSLSGVFGSNGVFPVFSNDSMLLYFSYFICVSIIHLMVDMLLWLVRWCHNIVNHGLGGASHE